MVRRRKAKKMMSSVERKAAKYKAELPKRERKLKKAFRNLESSVSKSYSKLRSDFKKRHAKTKKDWKHGEYTRACNRFCRDADHSKRALVICLKKNYRTCLSGMRKAA